MKQLITFIVAVLSLGVPARSQSYVGTWEMFPSYGAPSRLIETPGYVYTLAGTSLCGYDKSTGEVAAYNVTNRLNGNKVTGIWFDPQKKYLFVVYEDYNIDLLYDDGRVINVPDLRDAAITADKTVNNVGFANGKAYVGIKSGMLVIDADHGAVTESCIWGKDITHIAATDKKIVLCVGQVNALYAADIAGSHHNFDNSFKTISGGFYPHSGMMRLSGNVIYASNNANACSFTFDGDESTRAFIFLNKTLNTGNTNLQPTKNGLLITAGATLCYIASDGTLTEKTVADVNGHKVADWAGTGENVWVADASGYGNYNVNASAYAISKAKPRGTSGTNVGRIIQHPMTGNFYMSTVEQGLGTYDMAIGKTPGFDVFDVDGKKFNPVPSSLLKQSLTGWGIDNANPDILLVGYHTTGGVIADLNANSMTTINHTNSNISSLGSPTGITVDGSGNLWICEKDVANVNVIKALAGSWENTVDIAKWSKIQISGLTANHSTRMIVDEDKGIIVVTGADGISAVRMPDADKPITSSCQMVHIDCKSDEDGSTISNVWEYPALVIDRNGWLWIGSNGGVLVVRDTQSMFDYGFALMRPKIARNDGTNLADYLLNQVEVRTISVDENNQKWIGTLGSGLYRVSEDGTSILEHFTTENSDIPSNDIFAVCADRNSNDIYVGSAEGLSIYHSTTAPAAEDYKNAYAYPNPVTPDYTGYITITGLKADSLVKIADASGSIFFETRSDGGMAVWNGCDASGRRVRSGVYFVFASEAGESGSGAAVTKIVVVN